jgi:hypothetical protein
MLAPICCLGRQQRDPLVLNLSKDALRRMLRQAQHKRIHVAAMQFFVFLSNGRNLE